MVNKTLEDILIPVPFNRKSKHANIQYIKRINNKDGKIRYKCDKCEKSYKSYYSLLAHKNMLESCIVTNKKINEEINNEQKEETKLIARTLKGMPIVEINNPIILYPDIDTNITKLTRQDALNKIKNMSDDVLHIKFREIVSSFSWNDRSNIDSEHSKYNDVKEILNFIDLIDLYVFVFVYRKKMDTVGEAMTKILNDYGFQEEQQKDIISHMVLMGAAYIENMIDSPELVMFMNAENEFLAFHSQIYLADKKLCELTFE